LTARALVSLTCQARGGRPYGIALRRDAVRLLRLLDLGHCELSLLLTDDRAIRELNRTFRGKDRATDVLSFPQFESPPAVPQPLRPDGVPVPLGDIVISLDTAVRQADSMGLPLTLRLRMLLIHGLLHLLGYDHERGATEARRMFARERELLAALADADRRGARRKPRARAVRATAADTDAHR